MKQNELGANGPRFVKTMSTGIRLVLLGAMALVLLLASLLIFILVDNRIDNSQEAIDSIAEPWGKKQTIGGPTILIPYETVVEGIRYYRTMAILPDSLSIKATLNPEIRKRNIYKAVLYRCNVEVEAIFKEFTDELLPKSARKIYWERAYVQFGVEDVIGLKSFAHCQFGGETFEMDQTSSLPEDRLEFGGHLIMPLKNLPREGGKMHLSVDINGSQTIYFVPMGRTTDVELKMYWPDPSFIGRFLPNKREVTDSVTTAQWRVLSINRDLPNTYTIDHDLSAGLPSAAKVKYSYNRDNWAHSDLSFGVKLMITGDHYSLVNRSVKYAILLIIFTFLTVFFCDAFAKKNIPLFAYLLIGVAILLFYTLLLSISEYLGFKWAYLISAVAIIGLLTAYMYGFFRDLRYSSLGAGVLILLYALLYLLLQLETLPLLIGSIFLFIMLAVVMYISQKMEWEH